MKPQVNKSSSKNRLLIRFAVAVSLLVICVIIQACTRTDNKPGGPPEMIRIANIIPPFTAPVDVAELHGYYRQQGLSAAMQKYPYGLIALQAVLEGKADFATVAETPIMLAIMNGEKISIIATIQTSSKNNAIIARKDRISTPSDLKGKKIAATFGTISEFYMDGILAMNGISKSDMEVINLKPAAMYAALANGDIDAASTWNPPLMDMQKKLGARGITFYNEDMYAQSISVVAKQEYIKANPEKVRKLLRALVSAEAFIRKNPAEAQRNVADFNHMDVEMIREMWGGNNYQIALDQSLILALEDESGWAISRGLTGMTKIPNYLDFIYFDGLKSVKPEAVRILR